MWLAPCAWEGYLVQTTDSALMKKIRRRRAEQIRRKILRSWQLYLFLVPALIYFILFHYVPMFGVQIAFKDYRARAGIWGSKWVGLKHFRTFVTSFQFGHLVFNTIYLSLMTLVLGFPLPILLALSLNEIGNMRFRKLAQNLTYAPHFISVVVMVGMLTAFLSPTTGPVNKLIELFGGQPIDFMSSAGAFRWIYCLSGLWQHMGWDAILYLSALSGIDAALHEAAQIDGATRLQRIWHVNIPGILPTIVICLLLRCGQLLNIGYEKTYLMQNSLNLETSEIISTYVYKMGLQQAQFSFAAAVGLSNTLVNFLLLLCVNSVSKRLSSISLW